MLRLIRSWLRVGVLEGGLPGHRRPELTGLTTLTVARQHCLARLGPGMATRRAPAWGAGEVLRRFRDLVPDQGSLEWILVAFQVRGSVDGQRPCRAGAGGVFGRAGCHDPVAVL